MIDQILKYIAPHHCYMCQKIGVILCDSCENYIIEEVQNDCIRCLKPSYDGICKQCRSTVSYTKAWYVAKREHTLQKLLDDYKFERVKAIHSALGRLLDARLPLLPAQSVVVPIPTASKHIRVRGYDHIRLVARWLASQRNMTHSPLLQRKNQTVQLGNTAANRIIQAERAFYCPSPLDPHVIYLLVDDIYTTGSTINAASRCLRDAGAVHVWVAVIARQPLKAH